MNADDTCTLASPAPEVSAAVAPLRDPAAMLARTLAHWGGGRDFWVFGYASLIWRPEFESEEHRPASVHGWHRALRMAQDLQHFLVGQLGHEARAAAAEREGQCVDRALRAAAGQETRVVHAGGHLALPQALQLVDHALVRNAVDHAAAGAAGH
jgi:hypothetical protein